MKTFRIPGAHHVGHGPAKFGNGTRRQRLFAKPLDKVDLDNAFREIDDTVHTTRTVFC